MKNCKVCNNEAHKDLDYCKSCAEALCIIAEGTTLDQDTCVGIALTEAEAIYRLKLLIEKGWHNVADDQSLSQ